MQWDFQNKGKSGWTGKNSLVLEVPLRYLRPSIIIPYHHGWVDEFLFLNKSNFYNKLTIYINAVVKNKN